MKIGRKYHILKAMKVHTGFGSRIVLEFEDEHIFLPNSYDDVTDDIIEDINKSASYSVINVGEEGLSYKLKFTNEKQ